jgi:hypothetical protein
MKSLEVALARRTPIVLLPTAGMPISTMFGFLAKIEDLPIFLFCQSSDFRKLLSHRGHREYGDINAEIKNVYQG